MSASLRRISVGSRGEAAKRRLSSALPVLLAAAALGACATNSEGDFRTGDPCTQGFIDEVRLQRELAAAAPCCASFAGMPFVEPRKSVVLAIAKNSPVYDFGTGRSRFVALDLRNFSDDRAVLTPMSSTALTAPPTHTCTHGQALVRSRAVDPVVQWLDAQKQTLGAPRRGTATVTRGAAGWSFERPADAQFMVIYTDPSEYGSPMDLPAPRAGILETDTVGLAAALHPQRTLGPAKFTRSATGFFESLIP